MHKVERQPTKVANWGDLPDRSPEYALVEGVDLVVIRFGGDISVLYGRCLHRGALMSDGHVDGSYTLWPLAAWKRSGARKEFTALKLFPCRNGLGFGINLYADDRLLSTNLGEKKED